MKILHQIKLLLQINTNFQYICDSFIKTKLCFVLLLKKQQWERRTSVAFTRVIQCVQDKVGAYRTIDWVVKTKL